MSLRSALLLLVACSAPETENSGFGSGPGSPPASTSSPADSETSSSSSTTTDSTSSSSSSSGFRLDLGVPADLGPTQPLGCKGKIDFLFLISRDWFMPEIQKKLVDAFPKFIETITTKFAAFDVHIMVVDGDKQWGLDYCTADCPDIDPQVCGVPDYPCALLDTITACDQTYGAGVVFNAGGLAPNVPCDLPAGRRYLQTGDPNLSDTFACMAQGGMSGGDRLGNALAAAMTPELREGCNAGFLRDDALLVLAFVSVSGDFDSAGTPELWAQAVLDAKQGQAGSVVVFGILAQLSQAWCDTYVSKNAPQRLCEFARRWPFRHSVSYKLEDYGPAFDAATDLVAEACESFIPG